MIRSAMIFVIVLAVVGSAFPPMAIGQASRDTLAEIRARKVVRVYVESQFPPYMYRDEHGKLVGFEIDFARKIFADLGVAVEFTELAFAGLLPALAVGKADILMAGVGITAERLKRFDFSLPYLLAEHNVIVRQDSNIATVADLSGKTVGIAALTGTHLRAAQDFHKKLIAEGKPGINIKTYDGLPLVLPDLLAGRLDAIVENWPTVLYATQVRYPGRFKLTGAIGGRLYLGMVVRKGDQALLQYMNRQLRKFKRDGTLAALQMKWFRVNKVDQLPDTMPSPEELERGF